MKDFKEYTILDAKTPIVVTSSTDATPIVVTSTAHGFANDDLVMIYGHTTNIAANGVYRIANKTDNTFELVDRDSRADIAGTGGGAGSNGIVVAAPKIPLTKGFRIAVISFFTSGTATLTAKVAGSIGATTPNFGATVSPTNAYDFLQVIDLEDNSTIDGDTGIAAVGADVARQFEVNVNATEYMTIIPTAWTQGALTIKMLLTNNQ